MATPTGPDRKLYAAGFKKHTTWGTAVALGATDEVLLREASGIGPPEIPIIPLLESDHVFVKQSILGNVPPKDITIPAYMRYEMGALGRAIAMLFGTAGVPTDLTGAYKHTLQWADASLLFGCYAEEFPGKIYEATSAMPFKLELGFADSLFTAALTLKANTVIETSAVNTLTQMDALTLPASFRETVPTFQQAVVKMNAESGAAVTAETALVVSDLSIVYERALEGTPPHVAGSATVVQPVCGGHEGGEKITVKLGFPRMNATNAAYFATFIAGTPQKMLIQLTGALITGALYYDFKFYFPRLIMKNPSYTKDEIIKAGLELITEESAAAPTGMTYLRPYAEVVNLQTTDYLA